MNMIRTTIVDGHVHVHVADDLPDGTEVVVQISTLGSIAMPGDGDWDNSPAGIEAWLKQYDSLETLELAQRDREVMATALLDQKAWEKDRFFNHAEELRKLWE